MATMGSQGGNKGTVVVIEPEEAVRSLLEESLTDEGYAVVSVARFEGIDGYLQRDDVVAIICDIFPVGMGLQDSARKVFERSREELRRRRVAFVIISAFSSNEMDGFDFGAAGFAFVEKPFRLAQELFPKLAAAIASARAL